MGMGMAVGRLRIRSWISSSSDRGLAGEIQNVAPDELEVDEAVELNQ